jgi:hypothetical protein
MKIFLLCISFIFSLTTLASNVGTVIKKQGKAELLSDPSKSITGTGKKVLYEGIYYNLKKVRPGTKIKNGNILRTGSKSKVKIVYKNGDQFNIGEGTAYQINWKKGKSTESKASTVNLIYGSLRGIISKKGPRNTLRVKSKNAVMGVRGTDFHFNQKGTSGETSISVLRGKVDVSEVEKPEKVVKVQQGFSAEIKKETVTKITKGKTKKKTLSTFELVKTTKNELVEIQKSSKIIEKAEDKTKQVSVTKEIKELEKQAIKVTMDDIKEYQPKVYNELKGKDIQSVDTVNTVVVTQAFEKAPAKKTKKGFDELDIDLKDDAYKKYFKIDEKI